MYRQFHYLRRRPLPVIIWCILLLWLLISLLIGVFNVMTIFDTLAGTTFPAVVAFAILLARVVAGCLALYGVFFISSWARWVYGIFTFLWVFTDSFVFVLSLIGLVLYVYLYDEYMAMSLSTPASKITAAVKRSTDSEDITSID